MASEPYGLVEETPRYLRMDGETPGRPRATPAPAGARSSSSTAPRAGTARRHRPRRPTTARRCPVTADELRTAEITTRDIDRGDVPALPAQGDLRGARRRSARRCAASSSSATARCTVDARPRHAARRACGPACATGASTASIVIGQGTAAIAGQSLAAALVPTLAGRPACASTPCSATELSGFGLRPDMSDTLVVAISQSGTTTDTNRTVDLARGRGATVIAIVNRRNSDLTDKSDGVLYTSDGRDVEMSVAVDQGVLRPGRGRLPARLSRIAERGSDPARRPRHELLAALRELPDRDGADARQPRPTSPSAAQRLAPRRRYWAVVGNGANRIAAARAAHQAVASSATSRSPATPPRTRSTSTCRAEPLILVCAAGLERLERRRRGQGGRDLPRPQGRADRDRQRGRGALRRRARR